MVASSVCVCIGQLFWKISGGGNVALLSAGFFLYFWGACIMIYAYRFGSLSVLQPVLSLNYVFALFIGRIFLQEEISVLKMGGVSIILAGLFLLCTADE